MDNPEASTLGGWVPGHAILPEEEEIWCKDHDIRPVRNLSCLLGTIWWMFLLGS